MDTMLIIDFGSQYTQLIARRVRELQVYCEILPWNADPEQLSALRPRGWILSGGPNSVFAKDAPQIQPAIIESRLPILGICYGMQALTHALGGQVAESVKREYGSAEIDVDVENPLLPSCPQTVWMSHGDRIEHMPRGFVGLAHSSSSPYAAMGDLTRNWYGVQFHPEVHHTPGGRDILRRFVHEICGCKPEWTPASIIETSAAQIKARVGNEKVIVAVSGGVDSSVAAALMHRAIGDQLHAVFVDTGLLRKNEAKGVHEAFTCNLGHPLVTLNIQEEVFSALKGVTDPEAKRKIIGEKFIRTFEAEAARAGNPRFLVQGTIYPDVVESSTSTGTSHKIKSHHNVGGLPTQMQFQLIEPLRLLFKDEVRLVGEALGLPHSMVWRQPFPGPGLAVRCLGEVTLERVEILREADDIFTSELTAAGMLNVSETAGALPIAQAFAVLLPVQSVGVMGDQRTYQETIALRAVTSEDFMTADWAEIPHALLGKVANRIVNEVHGVNRVVYDITSKPPATIEWE
ncbi:MAG: glutamine-hydrolyzing GMP synthase [Anaerolineaceae bacterium]